MARTGGISNCSCYSRTSVICASDLYSPVIDLSLGAIYGSILPKIGVAHDGHKVTECLTSDNVKPAERALSDFPYLEPAV